MRAVLTLLLALCLVAAPAPASAKAVDFSKLTVMTEQYPPYNFLRNGQVVGLSTDVVVEALRRMGAPQQRGDILLLPWAQGYRRVQKDAGNVLFSMTRTPEREDLFQWAGPLSTVNIGLVARKDAGITVADIQDLRRHRVGVVRDDVGQQLLVSRGVPQDELDVANDSLSNIRKLDKGRIDLFCYDVSVVRHLLAQEGMDPQDFEPVFTLLTADMYVAFNRDEDPALVAAFQQAIDAIRAPATEGGPSVYDKIAAQYLQ